MSNEEKDVKENMEEIDLEICPKKTSKNWDNIKKHSKCHENMTMNIFIYIAYGEKMGKEKIKFWWSSQKERISYI